MSKAPLDFAFAFGAMACPCEIRIGGLPLEGARHAADIAINEVRRIERKYSRYLSDSMIGVINAAAIDAPVRVDSETAHLLDFAAKLFVSSDGLFDCTSGLLRRAWDFRAAQLPSAEIIEQLLPRVGWQHVQWDGASFAFTRAGMELDLGGFGKEYAVDRATTLLESYGVAHALVNLGGDVRALGAQIDGAPWDIGIRDPRAPEGSDALCFASLPLARGALATSGNYERFIEVDGVRYCHILNPKTGWPVNHWHSVSVLAPACVLAGALSTIAMLKGEHATQFLEEEGVAFLLCDARGTVTQRSVYAVTVKSIR